MRMMKVGHIPAGRHTDEVSIKFHGEAAKGIYGDPIPHVKRKPIEHITEHESHGYGNNFFDVAIRHNTEKEAEPFIL